VPNAPIVTVTLNPALDEAVALAAMELGGTNRVRLDAFDPGGKGINASRVIHRLGRQTLALGFVGGYTGELLHEFLEREGVPHAFDGVDGLTRVNVMIYETACSRRTRMYLPGPQVAQERLEEIRKRLAAVEPGGLVVLAGSLPPGLPPATYRDLVRWLRDRDVRTIVDASGEALAAAFDAEPLLVKPNLEEAETLLGRTLRGDDQLLAAARALCERGAQHAVISLGESGAIAVGPGGAWKAVPPRVTARSTVGSGDSMVAGLAIGFAEGGSLEEGLRWGSAAGAATAATVGTTLGTAAEIRRLASAVTIQRLEQAA
jgi:1-phosphofructokinase family hexose kinase